MSSGTPPVHPQDLPESNSSLSSATIVPAGGSTSNYLTLSPNGSMNGGSGLSSSASSIQDGSTSSTQSDSGESASSLGGLNHVNDGVGGSTVQRRMSRAYSTDDLPPRRLSVDLRSSTTSEELEAQDVGVDPGLAQASFVPPTARSRRRSSSTAWMDEDLLVRSESCWKTWLRKRVPAFGWLVSPGYNLQDLPDDLIAGITISTVVIPQSMAYAMLAPLPPVYGLYTSVVPILIYCIFGTSRHMHTGTFAITTLLLGQAVRGLMAKQDGVVPPGGSLDAYSLTNTLLYESQSPSSSPLAYTDPDSEQRFIGMILTLSLVVGVVQIVMSFLRIGGWASKHLLPDALVGGFNTAAVFHIGTSQLKHFLGLKDMPSPQGAFALLKSWLWIGENISSTNLYTVGLGSIAILFMLVMRKLERKRKADYELHLRKKEMFLVQQRQAVSAAIIRSHEEQRQQQRQWQLRQQQKQDGGNNTHLAEPLSPYASPDTDALASNISLQTVADGHGNGNGAGPSTITFVPNVPRTANDAEQAMSMVEPVATPKDRQVYIPIPDILLAVILLTLLNVAFSLDMPRSEGGMGIDVIGSIPKGLPHVAFPPSLIVSGGATEWMSVEFLKKVILPMLQPALLIAVIIYVMSFSIAKQFGKRYGYKVDANQEMFALGLASMGGSMFSGYACTGSLTRTAILSQSGGKTPLASMVGVVIVTLTLVCLTWCFERVPNTVLAAIVLVALQSLVMQITEPLKLWRLGYRKACIIWSVTFLGVLIVSVELGIAIGIVVVLLSTAYSWAMNRGEDGRHGDPLLAGQHRRSSTRRLSQTTGVSGAEEAAGSLLNNDNNQANGRRRRQAGGANGSAGARLTTSGASPVSRGADWKRKMMRTEWGQRIANFLGLERPMFSDTLHTNTDDDDY
ncbi:hypothetical protein EMPS_07487 [Entomortierella parvispora]|uniref:SLC26A/SulP transporter domain-containing protein n=1 Tax=Entomortierella parvispora TaxID=205924 RepID=A0A9P3LYE3_9FUNG|nr:hypothetical protein EMPS_07487 [Entomortierella parvispora]